MFTFLKNYYADHVKLFLKWQTNRLKNHMDGEEEEKDFSFYEINGQAGGSFCISMDPDYIKTGGTADVYFGWEAEKFHDEREEYPTVAVKFYRGNSDNNLDYTMYERELDALKKLGSHDNIVKFIDYGFDKSDNTFFIVSEYHSLDLKHLISQLKEYRSTKTFTYKILGQTHILDDVDLKEMEEELEKEKNQSGAEIWLDRFNELLEGILNGLIHAIDQGIMHRDLKPANILLSFNEESDQMVPLLIDFGLSSRPEKLSIHKETIEKAGTHLYTPEYSDEESKFPGSRDVYSWGVIAIEYLSGETITCYPDLIRVFEDIIEPKFPKSIVEILGKCISVRAKDRPKDVKKLLNLLEIANSELKI